MKKSTKLIISGVVIAVAGVIILIASLAAAGWKFKDTYEMKTYTESGYNKTVNIDWDAGNVRTEFYDGDKIEISYPASKMYKVNVRETVNGLSVRSDSRYILWIGPVKVPDTVIKLPKNDAYSIIADVDAGSVYLADGAYSNLTVDIDAGSFKCGTITCNRFDCNIDAGNVKVGNVTSNFIECDLDAGNAEFDGVTCPVISVDIDAGSLTLIIDAEQSLYTIRTDVSAGRCNVYPQRGTSLNHNLKIDVSAGSANVTFTK